MTAVVILTLLGGVGCMLVERTWSRFHLATTFDFDAIPLAIEIPPEDLHRVRQPDYVLPKRGQKDKFAQLLDRIPEFSFAPPNETKAAAVPGPESVDEPPSRPSLQNETNTDLSRFQPDKPSAKPATGVRLPSSDVATASYIDDRHAQPANEQIPQTKDSARNVFESPGSENGPSPMRPIPAADAPPRRDFSSDFDPAEHRNDFAGDSRPRTVDDLKFISPESQTTTALPTKNNSFEPAGLPEPAAPTPAVAVSDNATANRFAPPFPRFAETLPPTLSATPAHAPLEAPQQTPNSTTAPTAATTTEESASEPVRSANERIVTVVAGDTLWELTERVYGDGRLFRAVFAVNETALQGSSKLQPGTLLRFPPQQELVRRFPGLIPADLLEPAASQSYQTAAGDSLFSIARDELGQASRYLEIMELNRDVLPANVRHSDQLPSGLKLILPNR